MLQRLHYFSPPPTERVAVCCSVLQCVAVLFQCVAARSLLPPAAPSVLPCVAARRSVRFQCVAVCWSFLFFLHPPPRARWLCDINHLCDTTHLCAMSELCDMTHSSMWHDSCTYATQFIPMCDMTHSHMWHDSFTYVIKRSHTRNMTHSQIYVSFIDVTWLIHRRDTSPHIRPQSLIPPPKYPEQDNCATHCNTTPHYTIYVTYVYNNIYIYIITAGCVGRMYGVVRCGVVCFNVSHALFQCDAARYLRGVLQCGVVCCSVLQCVAVCCRVLQYVIAVWCSAVPVRCCAVWCSVLQCVAVCFSVLQCIVWVWCSAIPVRCCTAWYSVLQCVSVCCSALLQCDAARCLYSVVQCGAVCCSVL